MNDGQGNLFDDEPPTIQQAFETFHHDNPWVYSTIVAMARELANRGRARMGIGMLCEVVRWEYYRRTADANSDFKINNNYRSRYVRLIETQEPDLTGRFETRRLRSP